MVGGGLGRQAVQSAREVGWPARVREMVGETGRQSKRTGQGALSHHRGLPRGPSQRLRAA